MEELGLKIRKIRNLKEDLKDFPFNSDDKTKKKYLLTLQKTCKTTNPKTLVAYLLFLLQEEIELYQYQEDYSFINAIFPCIGFLLQGHDVPRDFLENEINYTKDLIIRELKQKPGDIKKNHKNYLFLKELLSNLDGLQLVFLTELHESYHGDKYPIVHYLMFKKKNFAYIKTAISHIPYLVTMVDQNGVTLLDNVINHYIDSLKSYMVKRSVSEIEDITYYDSLTSELLNGTPLQMDNYKKLRGRQLEKLKSFLNSVKDKDYPKDVLDRITFSVDIMYEKLVLNRVPKLSFDELCYQYDIRDHFPTKVEMEARKYSNISLTNTKKDSLKPRRVIDSSKEVILTIDGRHARELDDGISIKKLGDDSYLLGIHIADVLGYLPMFGEVINEAEKRGSSLYFNSKMIAMMPSNISLNKMSLKANNYHYAKSYYVEVDSNGIINNDSFRIEQTLIEPYCNMSYQMANLMLETKEGMDTEVLKSLELFSSIMPKVNQHLTKNDFYPRLVDSFISPMSKKPSYDEVTLSEQIVSTSMLLVNYLTASYFLKSNYPFIYRNHEMREEDIARLKRLEKKLNPNSTSWNQSIHKIENLFDHSYYGVDNKGHWALGLDSYCHVSSPLRRYPDILANYVMDQLLFKDSSNQKVYEVEKVLTKGCKKLNSRMTLIRDFTDQVTKK